MKDAPPKPVRFADLGVRLASGVALGAVALVDVWLGGAWVAALACLVFVVMIAELHRMVSGDRRPLSPVSAILAVSGVAAIFLALGAGLGPALVCLAAGAAVAMAVAPHAAVWLGAGHAYIGAAMCLLIVMRQGDPDGMWLVLWLVLVVVAADVGAYFVGRTVGGARLWPKVSPGKTRSGALGGLVFAAIFGLPLGVMAGSGALAALLLSIGIGIASQAGDLLESGLKRRFAVKDASSIIPGHGGAMDRLDGLLGGVWFLALCDALGRGAVGS